MPRVNTSLWNPHRKGPIPTGADAYHAGRGAMEVCMLGYQKTDGIYTVRATAKDTTGQVYCDMTTDGGGWMLIARTDHRTAAGNVSWGWLAQGTGSLTDFTQAYALGWVNWHNAGARFTEFIFGNRKNINNNQWGPFIYKRFGLSATVGTSDPYATFMSQSTFTGSYSYYTVVKADLSIYNYSGGPSMQSLFGYVPDVSYNSFYMRDVPGNSNLGYGLHSDGMFTTYINNTDAGVNGGNGWQLSGPWAIAGSSYNTGTGDYNQTDGSGNTKYGGTSQCMLMVRNSAAAL